jgi:hypothetical protein
MDHSIAQFAIKTLLTEIREQREEASSVAKASEACADAGNIDQGVKVALDVEQPVYRPAGSWMRRA